MPAVAGPPMPLPPHAPIPALGRLMPLPQWVCGSPPEPSTYPPEHQALPLPAASRRGPGCRAAGWGMASFLYLFQKEVSQGSRNAVWPRAPSPCDCPPVRVSAVPLSSGLPDPLGLLATGGLSPPFQSNTLGGLRSLIRQAAPSKVSPASDVCGKAKGRRLGPPSPGVTR